MSQLSSRNACWDQLELGTTAVRISEDHSDAMSVLQDELEPRAAGSDAVMTVQQISADIKQSLPGVY